MQKHCNGYHPILRLSQLQYGDEQACRQVSPYCRTHASSKCLGSDQRRQLQMMDCKWLQLVVIVDSKCEMAEEHKTDLLKTEVMIRTSLQLTPTNDTCLITSTYPTEGLQKVVSSHCFEAAASIAKESPPENNALVFLPVCSELPSAAALAETYALFGRAVVYLSGSCYISLCPFT